MSTPHKAYPTKRLTGFDYRSTNTYFVTICLNTRSDLFGYVTPEGQLHQSEIGNMIAVTLISLSDPFPTGFIADFVVMPDHVHALIGLEQESADQRQPTLGETVGWFKGMTTHRYGRGVATLGWPRYVGKLWQQGYYDHVIRDERDLEARMKYIERNPFRWAEKRNGEMF
jgi:putative transposase